ncbi:hypothetical protein AK82_04715 [Streptococcus pneumoniae K2521]|nr:hypothetical protein AK82_04715 [Streptococcus pneumoniae K2521]
MGLFFYNKIGSIISIVDLPTTNIIESKKECKCRKADRLISVFSKFVKMLILGYNSCCSRNFDFQRIVNDDKEKP